MTCKDCLYCEVCKDRVAQLGYDFDENGQIPSCGCEVARGFKNKAEFVEVVRCKECKRYEKVEYFSYDSEDATKNVCRLLSRQMQEDDFCSYGERKDNGSSSNL